MLYCLLTRCGWYLFTSACYNGTGALNNGQAQVAAAYRGAVVRMAPDVLHDLEALVDLAHLVHALQHRDLRVDAVRRQQRPLVADVLRDALQLVVDGLDRGLRADERVRLDDARLRVLLRARSRLFGSVVVVVDRSCHYTEQCSGLG
jgi:hypothetical protein